MSTSACLDVNQTTPAVVVWEWDSTTRCLAEPDSKIKHVTFTTHFDKTCALFELGIPIKLKGISSASALVLRICPSSIASFNFISSAAVPEAVQHKLNSTTLCLDFRLNRHLKVLVPIDTQEPLFPLRAQSGTVLDAVRELCSITAFCVYIEAAVLSRAQLQAISDAINQGRLKSYRGNQDLTSMYGGKGAKMISLAVDSADLPPSYNETEPPPPSAPIHDRKRPRQDTQAEREDSIALLWAKLRSIKEWDMQRTEVLERENRHLRQDVDRLQERCAALEKSQLDLMQELRDVEATTKQSTAELGEEIDVRAIEIHEDMRALTLRVDYIEEGHDEDELVDNVTDRVTDRVLDHIRTRLSVD